jgi:hypothetical protein
MGDILVNILPLFVHSRTVHLDTIKVLLPTDAQNNFFKRILKFTLKHLQHVSVLLPSSGRVQFEHAKVTFVKTVH